MSSTVPDPVDQGSPTSGQTPPLVLVVEDSALQAMVLKKLLEENGLAACVAANGREALQIICEREVRLVISDIDMPEMDGYEMCRRIKHDPALWSLPVILLTTLSEVENIVLGLEAQADHYLTKPYDPLYLVARVRSLLDATLSFEAPVPEPPLEFTLNQRAHQVTAGRRQMLNLLLSTYENAVHQNRQLVETQFELHQRNQQLRDQSVRLKISEANFRAVLESNADGMVVVDSLNLVRFLNPAARALLQSGEAATDRLGRPFPYPAPAGVSREFEVGRAEADPLVLEQRVVETDWEGQPALLVSLRDVTERKRAERKIEEQREELREANLKLQALATTDGLTGLKNHRVFKARLEEEYERAARYHVPLSLVLLDVDRFKQFNDSFGHPAGDEVLKALAKILLMQTRNTDVVARYGGEEFALLLPLTIALDAAHIAERIRAAIEAAEWPLRPVTASLGVASFGGSIQTGRELIAAADAALYASKGRGRNCVTTFEQMPNSPTPGAPRAV